MCARYARYTIRKKTSREVADALEAEHAEDDEPGVRDAGEARSGTGVIDASLVPTLSQ